MTYALFIAALVLYAVGWAMDYFKSKMYFAHGYVESSWLIKKFGMHAVKAAQLAIFAALCIVVGHYDWRAGAWLFLLLCGLAALVPALIFLGEKP